MVNTPIAGRTAFMPIKGIAAKNNGPISANISNINLFTYLCLPVYMNSTMSPLVCLPRRASIFLALFLSSAFS